jgi:glutathione S-transferase
MKLYAFPPSPNSWKVLATAHHLGIALDMVFVDLTKGQSRTPEYLAINPSGRTPVLVDGDFVLPESNAIMTYLAGMKPGLLPAGAQARAQMLAWQCWSMNHWFPPAQVFTFERMVKAILGLGAADEARLAKAHEDLTREAQLLDAHLAGRTWLVGSEPTLADFEVGSYLFYWQPAQMPLTGFRHVLAWHERLAALPAWQATKPAIGERR